MNDKARILIVDDDESTRRTLTLIFGKKGYETGTAATGREAIEKARGRFFNLALLDIKLPDMAGVELLAPLKAMHPDMEVIMVTAYASLKTAVRALNNGALGYIIKPLDMDEVLSKARDVLEKQRLVMENRRLYQEAQRELAERKRAEEEIRRLSQFRESIIDTANVWLDVLDEKANVVIWNRAAEEISGYSREEVVGHGKIWEWLYPDEEYRSEITAEAAAIIEKGKVVEDFETIIRRKDGQTRIISWNSRNLLDENGNPIGSIALGRDITERKRAEEELIRLSIAVRMSTDSIVISDIEAKIIDVNQATLDMYGTDDKGDLIGKGAFDLLAPEDREKAFAGMQEVLEKGYAKGIEYHVITKNGSRIPVEMSVAIMQDADGELIGFVGISRDITERKRAEEELRESEEKHRTTFESTGTATVIVEEDTTLSMVNAQFEKLCGYSREEVEGKKSWAEFVVKDDRERMKGYHRLRRIAADAAPTNYEFRFIDRYGEIKDILLTIAMIPGTKKSVASLLDITERKRAEEALRKVNRALKTLSECNQVVVRATEEPALLHEICRLIVEIGGYRLAWIGFAEQDEGKTVRPVAQVGFEEGYLDAVDITWADTKRGSGPTGKAIRTGKPSICENTLTDPDYAPWCAEAIKRGYASSIALPLIANGQTLGALNIYAEDPDAFDAEEVRLLTELADNLAYGIMALRTRAEHKRAEGELQERERFLSSIFASIQDGLSILDKDMHIIRVNPAMERWYSHAMPLVGKKCYQAYHGRSERCEVCPSRQTLETGESAYEVVPKRGPGREVVGWLDLYSFPLVDVATGKVRGVIEYVRDVTERKRAEEELQHTLERLREALGGIIQTVALTVETKDPYTAGHQRRVGNLARAIANEMGLPQEQIDGIRMAGLIHDIGKISIPAEILSKPGRLNDFEWGMIEAHPQVSYDILKTVEFPWPVAEIVLQHHERMDGSGYPQGLSGDEIMLEARILAVADVVEAMASFRPYRPALGIDKALEEISQNRGILYDPEVVDTCLRLFTEKGFKFE